MNERPEARARGTEAVDTVGSNRWRRRKPQQHQHKAYRAPLCSSTARPPQARISPPSMMCCGRRTSDRRLLPRFAPIPRNQMCYHRPVFASDAGPSQLSSLCHRQSDSRSQDSPAANALPMWQRASREEVRRIWMPHHTTSRIGPVVAVARDCRERSRGR